MKSRDAALKTKRFEAAEKGRKVASLEAMIMDFEMMAAESGPPDRRRGGAHRRQGPRAFLLLHVRQGGRPAPRQPADVDCRSQGQARRRQARPRGGGFRALQARAGHRGTRAAHQRSARGRRLGLRPSCRHCRSLPGGEATVSIQKLRDLTELDHRPCPLLGRQRNSCALPVPCGFWPGTDLFVG